MKGELAGWHELTEIANALSDVEEMATKNSR